MGGNQYIETWTLEKSEKVFIDALEVAKKKENYILQGNPVTGFVCHYLGEVADEMDLYADIFLYLKNKYPQLETLYNRLKTKCERNCFSDSKKGIIKEATAIMNLKSNYGWTDRVQNDHTTGGDKMNVTPLTFFKPENDKDQ